MSIRKFSHTDIVLNTMRAYPVTEFTIYNSKVYYNDTPHHSNTLGTSSITNNILSITSSVSGGISLYEYNIDRDGYVTLNAEEQISVKTGSNPHIIPYITKDSAGASFKTTGKVSYQNEFKYGDIIQMNYPLTASISREPMGLAGALYGASVGPGARRKVVQITGEEPYPIATGSNGEIQLGSPFYPHFFSLKNRLNHYRYLSEHYAVSSDFGDGWDKATDALNAIYIPSIFYGSKISEGSIVLQMYITGTLAAELRDLKHNGELIQVSGSDNGYAKANDGKVAGVVLYNEGIILLTGCSVIASYKWWKRHQNHTHVALLGCGCRRRNNRRNHQ